MSPKERFIDGALWVSILTIGGLFVGFARSWMLGRMDPSGELLGIFATLLIFTSMAMSVGLFGGITTVSSFLPKIRSEPKKKGFLKTYILITLLWWSLALGVLKSFPFIFEILSGSKLDAGGHWQFVGLGTVVVLANVFIVNFQGHLRYREAAILSHVQTYALAAAILIAYGFFADTFRLYAKDWLLSLFIGVNGCVLAYGFAKSGPFSCSKEKWYVPLGFWRFAFYYQISSLLLFAYGNLDRLFILDRLGVRELGFYFLLMQLAMLIRLVPQRMGQVMLSTFSHLIAEKKTESLNRGYVRLCRMVCCFSLGVALVFILFAQEVCALFGEGALQRSDWLVYLSVVACFGALSNINAMIVLSREKMATCLTLNLVNVCVQVVATLAWITPYGVEGVIAARGLAVMIGQLLLFLVVARIQGLQQNGLRVYLICIALVCVAAFAVLFVDPLHMVFRVLVFCVLFGLFIKWNAYTIKEFLEVVPSKLRGNIQRRFPKISSLL